MDVDRRVIVIGQRRGKSLLMQMIAQEMADAGKRVFGPRSDGTYGIVEPTRNPLDDLQGFTPTGGKR